MRVSLFILAFLSALALPGRALTIMYWEELPYFGRADSPFYAGIQAGTIYVEDFEDGNLNTPHVTSWDFPRIQRIDETGTYLSRQIGKPSNPGNPISTYSVDEDDGLRGDFLGLGGNTWTTMDVATGQRLGRIEFRFDRDELGRLPTYVGFVITEVLDIDSDVSIGMYTPGIIGSIFGDGDEYNPLTWGPTFFPGDTRGHRFFGLYCDTGIETLIINNTSQIDHLQYGYAIPEPTTVPLLALLACAARLRRRRERPSKIVPGGWGSPRQGAPMFAALALTLIQSVSAGDVRVAGTLEYQSGSHTLDWLHFQVLTEGTVNVQAIVRGPNLRRGWLVLGRFNEVESCLTEIKLLSSTSEEVAFYSEDFSLQPGRWAVGFTAATTDSILGVPLSPSSLPFINYGTGAPDGYYTMRVTGNVEGLEFWEGQLANDFKVTYLKEPLLEITSFSRINENVWSIRWRASLGRSYVVQYSRDLSIWSDLTGEITLSSGFATTSVFSQPGDLHRYFRVRKLS